jgi:transcriptional regulator with XRE-family HTH domain
MLYEFEGFGKRLQSLRKQKNMTQEDIADRVGVTPQAVAMCK